MRLILQNQDLSGQTIEGEPFSYIGECTGTDIKFTGDWTHVSHYSNDFLRPDWSQAKTRWSYSRFNTFIDFKGSPDLELLDHEMMLALLRSNRSKAADVVIDGLETDQPLYVTSWGNLAPLFRQGFSSDADAIASWSTLMGGRKHLIAQMKMMMTADRTKPAFDVAAPPTEMPDGGVVSGDWGIAAKNHAKEFRVHWRQLPKLTRPHDRVEMAERLEALIEQKTDQRVTLYVQSILPWRCRVGGKEQARIDLTRSTLS